MKNNKDLPADTDYSKSYMSVAQHIGLYIICFVVLTCVMWVFYHNFIPSAVMAALCSVYVKKEIVKKKILSRKKQLRRQFRDMLQSLSVSVGAGATEIAALESSYKELSLTYNESSDIMIELKKIILKYKNGGIRLRDLFMDFGNRSGVDDILSFATIFDVIEGKSNRFGEIVRNTYQIISDKMEIEQEIETTISSAKSEAYIMLVMPVVVTLAMSMMGGGISDNLYNSLEGNIIATIAIIIFIISFILSQRFTEIKV